jgi:hypothetical protein
MAFGQELIWTVIRVTGAASDARQRFRPGSCNTVSSGLSAGPAVLRCWARGYATKLGNPGGLDMKTILAIASIAIIRAASPLVAPKVEMPLLRQAPRYALASLAGQNTDSAWNGRWEGTTVSGQQLVLQLQLQGDHITGRLMVGKQSAKIVYGKIVGDAFALTTGPIDGHRVDATGRLVGDAIELAIEGVTNPLTLMRVK